MFLQRAPLLCIAQGKGCSRSDVIERAPLPSVPQRFSWTRGEYMAAVLFNFESCLYIRKNNFNVRNCHCEKRSDEAISILTF